MKVGIITFHFVSNQGGVLQCFATQTFLEKQGHEARVIDYRPSYHTVRYDAVKNPFTYARWYWRRFSKKNVFNRVFLTLRSFLRCIYLNIKKTDSKTAAIFDSFIGEKLNLTEKYTTLKELKSRPPEADAYITGSDQLWNPDLLDFAFDPAYFLQFGDDGIPRVAYAVSTGKQLSKAERAQLKELCGALSAISIREYDGEVVDAVGKDVHACIDPTLLLDAEDYAAIESGDPEAEPYIFVYGFEDTEGIHQAVELAKEKYNCRIINGSPHRISIEGAQNLRDYGPDRFLTLVKNARCVVTNSFHGTAFSIIYKKDFITVTHSTRGGRMTDILAKLGLGYRLWGSPDFSFEGEPDYALSYEKLNTLRIHSAEYLFEAISGKRGEAIPHYDDEAAPTVQREGTNNLKAYSGYYLDAEKLNSSASGGAANAFAEAIISQGGAVFGVRYSEDYKTAYYGCAERVDELAGFLGSKYIYPEMRDSDGRSVFDAVEEKLLSGKKVLFVGLGCAVSGLLRRLEQRNIDTQNLYTIDLVCHGPTLPSVQRAFIEDLEKRYRSRVVSFETRNKKYGWTSPYVRAGFENGKVYLKPLYETDLGFALRFYCRKSCYRCRFKGDSHAADITVGDYWGLKPGMAEYNPKGVSLILTRSDKGEKLLSELEPNIFHIADADTELAFKNNPMFLTSARKPSFYDSFEEDLKNSGLHYAVKHSAGYGVFVKAAVKNRLKRLTKK